MEVVKIYKHKIELVTNADIVEFVRIANQEAGEVKLIDGTGFCTNGKSLLGTMSTVEWKSLFCVSENDIYSSIKKFCVE